MLEFKLPAIGEGVVEGEIVRWLKKPGDRVAANEPLVEVMTDKATVEIPSPQDAVIAEIRADEGVIAAVGQVIAVFAAGEHAVPVPVPVPVPDPSSGNGSGKVLATPAARQLAQQSGIDLGSVQGDRGRITKAHVELARASSQEAAPRPAPTHAPAPTAPSARKTELPAAAPIVRARPGEPQHDETIPFRGLRRKIAEGMVKAYTTAVHYTYVETIDVTKLVAVREQAKQAAADEGVSLNYLPFIVKAVIRALKKFPIVNAELDESAGHIVVKKRYSIGIATATDNGLIVPVVHDADRLSLLEIAGEIARVSEAARTGKASREELSGSTFTITSLGTMGGLLATPILNYPEVGILGVHAIRKVPVVDDNDAIVIGHQMNLSISLDHRVVDGYEGAKFLQEVRRYLEDPTLLLLSGI
jgi:pyruvate dehydrogenase E2 component (dihydrolipoamide acetyltransferase)